MKNSSFLTIIFFTMLATSFAQKIIPLYDGVIPNSKENTVQEKTEIKQNFIFITKVSNPTLTIFLPPASKANGTAVIICPGGGYRQVSYGHEGVDVAKKFNKIGVAAFVLKYRLPDNATMIDKEIGAFQDVQQALKLVRENVNKWKINTEKIGMLGFSAGGHLVSTIGTHSNMLLISNGLKINLQPNFMMLIYPVISFMPRITYAGCVNDLVGENAPAEKIKMYSNELQVTSQTPPAFLVHATDDNAVNPENSILFYQALLKNKVPAELHLYQTGGHGNGLALPSAKYSWFTACKNWMGRNGWLKK